MTRTRRGFLRTGAAAVGGSILAVVSRNRSRVAAQNVDSGIECLDYGRSFIAGRAPFNSVRFWVESRTTVFDDQAGTETDYYQCASCKSENTFAETELFKTDNYDFLPIFGGGHWLVFRRPAEISPNYRTICTAEELWDGPRMMLHEPAGVALLDSFERIRDATAAGKPIVTQTEIWNEETGLRAVIECPTKTMNVSLEKNMYQVDTGPIAYPDLSKRFEPQIDCLSLAFIAFNAPHFASFIIEQPTPLIKDEKEECQVYHYSSPFSLPAKNRVLALEST